MGAPGGGGGQQSARGSGNPSGRSGRQALPKRRLQVRQAFRVAAALAAVALLAAGCAKPSSSSTNTTTTSHFLGCMVTDTGGINDKSFNQSSWAGMQAAAATNPNITVKYLPSTATSDYAKNISTFISQKCGVIVTVGFLMGAATQSAAL